MGSVCPITLAVPASRLGDLLADSIIAEICSSSHLRFPTPAAVLLVAKLLVFILSAATETTAQSRMHMLHHECWEGAAPLGGAA